jgi:hypothetical protein
MRRIPPPLSQFTSAMLCHLSALLLVAGLLGALAPNVLGQAPVLADSVDCSATSDPRIADCSPTTTTYPIEEDLQRSVSGRALALTVSADGKRLYAGTFSGVWRSDDSGVTWHQLTQPQPPMGDHVVPGALPVPNVFDIAVSPANADIVLAATAWDTRVQSKNGIYWSTNGGETWSLAHQFTCPGVLGVGQIVFSPDNPHLVYAAGGCAIAISEDAGETWRDVPMPDRGIAWHLAVAPQESSPTLSITRRVYAAGDDQIWYSTDGGNTWARDTAPIIPEMGLFVDPVSQKRTKFGTVGTFPDASGFSDRGGNSPQVLAVEPNHPDHLYVTVANISNGPAYYFPNIPPGENCEERFRCGGAAVWLGDYSQFSQGESGVWKRLASPPAYYGGSTISGRVYIATQTIQSGYLLFLSDGAHVHVSQGRPEESASWHRLDGRDASQSSRENDLTNKLFLHVDPHAIAISSDFSITLKRSDIPAPFDQNSELDAYQSGTIWMANDGGVYRSAAFDPEHDSVGWHLGSGLATLQLQGPFAGVAIAGNAPALYFGVPDNDDFFSLNGGATWQNSQVINCGDCPPWFADLAQPNRVLEFDRNPYWILGTNPEQNQYWRPGLLDKFVPLPPGFASDPFRGYRPIILTRDGEEPLTDGDYMLIRDKPDGTRVVLRTTNISSIMAPIDWDTDATQQGPSVPANVNVAQASGGIAPLFFMLAIRALLDASGSGKKEWQSGSRLSQLRMARRWSRGDSTSIRMTQM